MSSKKLALFRKTVLGYWKKEGRHALPWRRTKDPYRILVSEIMLQQTQVNRVSAYYMRFLKRFPTLQSLARARLSEVLGLWSGLGYNRRAKYLRDAAKAVVNDHKGKFPKSYDELRKLPGVGDYTARAVRVFAFKELDILIETNIRTAFFHYFHSSVLQNTRISDKELFVLAGKAAQGHDARIWHWALMDYGAFLKRSGVRLNRKSAHYSKQTKFEGSLRQLRGEVVRKILKGEKWELAVRGLKREGLIVRNNGKWQAA